MLLSSNHFPTFLGLNTVSRVLSMGWVPCRGDRYYSLPGVAKDNASETHGHNASFLASALDSDRWDASQALEKWYRAISLHSTHPTPLEPIESRWSGFLDQVISKLYMPNGIIWIRHAESTELE
ncbi:hypothetical protein TNIN_264881 [Trichonephila inaurata madagascariensis]|uniref:Uncharacterized protein n=1 Tax=Trichonephila inaurata madagascariensis TaxID=2747483 RepID=A0A8X6MM32_9ARAC|nr:hypothetical protein TNIN_264881 [Trichonephila inaurata madagascariensis]